MAIKKSKGKLSYTGKDAQKSNMRDQFPDSVIDGIKKKYKLDAIVIIGYKNNDGCHARVRGAGSIGTVMNLVHALEGTADTLLDETAEQIAAGMGLKKTKKGK